ncbi:hypothetical protein QK292_11955 [Arthrobacter sp. AL08]|uniref:hypothetical protein n=1 Tax=Micrococcaceae TaxID=1268 RepID=UPI001CFF7A04|nr:MULTISPECIES: hypothetical protein [Micrococcaceae]MCB5282478.1 hypothetical protein [Arthrobacter sp. ES1]MDD1477434.1 hypothetical protein [Arthrobacter sp. H16F315]MDI3242272.1 hypothetical protein [Arthrobacter sp. AL05]MDI3278282.1 hypothetical protein [Arthrobacter sp. AL08]MDJ0351576.1 hypothetical protein [Pseudarthrobacter sp. PH31-O2]
MSSHNALLKHVSIAAEDTSLVAKFDIDGNIPGQGAYVVGLVAATPDHSHQRRMGIEFMNGEAVSFYCFSHDGTEENFDLKGVDHSGNTITGHFPLSTVMGLAKGHLMTAFSDCDGREYQSNVAVEEAL